ncbi:hypothetical protein Esi_0012_0144 [Ectocarpus siliculosus]|uniref:Secreted protein n=1 Tax=Ectocarpus siliculosus TaxID=2880 RepID=D8LDK5_ECTSI|nr:hypothetical protein Esi_0012_0144 [Ectocarpus siliculosus]|eukprot:CBN74079.1 hypothetical protein Esi_0012_0144 [Ectocarpus siliculosus]
MMMVMVVTVSMALPMALPTALMAVWAMQGTAQPSLGGTMTAVIECEERPITALALAQVRVGFSLPEKRESGSELEMATKGVVLETKEMVSEKTERVSGKMEMVSEIT